MALKALISPCIGHLRTIRRAGLPRLALHNVIWGHLRVQPLSGGGERAESEGAEVTETDKVEESVPQSVVTKKVTYEECLREFLLRKGAGDETINSIISRYPRATIRTSQNLQIRWKMWKSILKSDAQVLETLERSPESFFRSSDLESLADNINFLNTLGLTPNTVTKLMAKAPRTFSNRVELNKDMVELLQNVCVCLGGDRPEDFSRRIITKNIYILTRSTKRIQANIKTMQSILKIPDAEMLEWIQGRGADILDLGNAYLQKNFQNLQEKLRALNCSEEEITACVFTFPKILYLSHLNFNSKMDLILGAGVKARSVLEVPRVLEVSLTTLRSRMKELEQCGYDFQASGIGVLAMSSSRFKAKLGKLKELSKS